MAAKKSSDGVYSKKEWGGEFLYYWRVGTDKSRKGYRYKTEAAMEYIKRYIEKNPKMEDLVADKTWDEIFRMFNIQIPQIEKSSGPKSENTSKTASP